MKPIKLTMTAFGPYPEKEIIDFKKLGKRLLFLITGPTGAGKTTIFDAISFAMYGKASGEVRTAESLRSQFARSNVLTEVELEFELKDKLYKVKRIPKQCKPKSRGEGMTEQKAEAEIVFEENGETRAISGKNAVDEKIENIVGISADQFRQIMMIPQGEFKKLLVSDSTDREKILRQLFDTGIYSQIQNTLYEKSKVLRKERESLLIEMKSAVTRFDIDDELVESIGIDENPAGRGSEKKYNEGFYNRSKAIISSIEEFNDNDKKVIDDLKRETEKKEEELETSRKNKEKAELNNSRLMELQSLGKGLKLEKGKKPEYDQKERLLRKLEAAEKILPIRKNILVLKAETAAKIKEVDSLNRKLDENETELKEKQIKMESLESTENREKKEKIIQAKITLETFLEKVKGMDSLQNEVDSLEKSYGRKNICLEQEVEKVSELDTNLKEMLGLKEKRAILEAKMAEITSRGKEEREKKERAEEGKRRVADSKKLLAELEDKEILLEGLEEKEKKQRLKDANLNINYLANQAALLAKELQEAEPCPVCGSIEHPNLAEVPVEVPTEAELESSKLESENLAKELNNDRRTISVLKERAKINNEEMEKTIPGFEPDEVNIEYLEEVFDKLTGLEEEFVKKIECLKKEYLETKKDLLGLKDLDERIQKSENILVEVRKKVEESKSEIDELSRVLIEKKTIIADIFKQIPESQRDLKKLNLEISVKEKEISEMEAEVSQARKTYTDLKNKNIEIDARIQEIENQLKTSSKRIKVEEKNFEEYLGNENFKDSDEFEEMVKQISQINMLRTAIQDYNKKLFNMEQRINELESLVEKRELAVIDELEKEIYSVKQEHKELGERLNFAKNRLERNERELDEFVKLDKKIFRHEEEYKVLGKLSKVASGENLEGISFERYVLAAFLEDILRAANQRLTKMTNQRYSLGRTRERERKNKQSGLELEIYDNYTGKARHVKTLSGGESFKASLCMALGLSDVVQSYAGGISLDTMFIDEGFGSLDPESLDSAINCLIDLQKKGRLVGIISHVPELKERIDARLEVESTQNGSHACFVV